MIYLKDNFLKLFAFLAIGETAVFGAMLLQSDFLYRFLDVWGLRLPIVILAIFVAANTAVVGRLLDLTQKTGFSFSKVYDELRRAFIEQIVIIAIILVVSILANSTIIVSLWSCLDECLHGIILACLVFNVWLVFDIGIAMVKIAKDEDGRISKG